MRATPGPFPSRPRPDRVDDEHELIVALSRPSTPPRSEPGDLMRERSADIALPAPLLGPGLPSDGVAVPLSSPGSKTFSRLLRHRVWPLLLAADAGALLLMGPVAHLGWERLSLALVICIVIFSREGLYGSRLSLSVLQHLHVLLLAPIFAMCLGDFAASMRWHQAPAPSRVLLGLAAATVAVIGMRTAAYALVRTVRRRRLVGHNTLILGAGRVAADLARTLMARPAYGLAPVAFWDPDPFLEPSELLRPIHGADLAAAIRDSQSRVVIIAFSSRRESELVEVLRTCERLDCEVFLVPRLWELHQRSADMDEIWGVPLVRFRRPAFHSPWWRLKRLVDVVFVLAVAPLVAPVMAACALAVRVDTGPDVLFRQRRVGLDGREFDLLKFRSMRPATDQEQSVTWSIAHDTRVSRVGRLLRRSSLDELPQLWNVVRGDMSIVGPRPERPHFVKQFTETFPGYTARSRVPAGLTGWAQVNGLRGDTSIAERAIFDNYYIENWSLWFDFMIMARTLLSLVRRDGR